MLKIKIKIFNPLNFFRKFKVKYTGSDKKDDLKGSGSEQTLQNESGETLRDIAEIASEVEAPASQIENEVLPREEKKTDEGQEGVVCCVHVQYKTLQSDASVTKESLQSIFNDFGIVTECVVPDSECSCQRNACVRGEAHIYFKHPRNCAVAARLMNGAKIGNVFYKCRLDCRKFPVYDNGAQGDVHQRFMKANQTVTYDHIVDSVPVTTEEEEYPSTLQI